MAKGIATHAATRVKYSVFLTAAAYASRRAFKTSAELVKAFRLVAPASAAAAAETAIVRLGTSFRRPFMKTFCATETAMALHSRSDTPASRSRRLAADSPTQLGEENCNGCANVSAQGTGKSLHKGYIPFPVAISLSLWFMR